MRTAIDTFQPRMWTDSGPPLACKSFRGGCSASTLNQIADALRAAPAGRKLIIFISSVGAPFDVTNPDLLGIQAIDDMMRALQQEDVSVYGFDPRGLSARGRPSEALIAMAENTGGRAFVDRNFPWERVPEVFQENSSYYLLGYRPSADAKGGRYRRVTVKVNRPGVEVRSRSGFFTANAESSRAASKPPPSALDAAIAQGMPKDDLPLRLAIAPFAVPGQRDAVVAVVAGLREAAAPTAGGAVRRVQLVAAAFDTEWKSRGAQTQTVEITQQAETVASTDEGNYEVLARLPLAPGRYEVRLAASRDGRSGSVFADVDVPDFRNEDLSLSGVVLGRQPGLPVAPESALRDVLPIVPTTVRDLGSHDRATAFLRVYQGGKRAPGSVEVTSRIVDADNRIVYEDTRTLPAVGFGADRASDVRLTLPVARLTPGPYLLTIEASIDGRTAKRDLRFSVH